MIPLIVFFLELDFKTRVQNEIPCSPRALVFEKMPQAEQDIVLATLKKKMHVKRRVKKYIKITIAMSGWYDF